MATARDPRTARVGHTSPIEPDGWASKALNGAPHIQGWITQATAGLAGLPLPVSVAPFTSQM
jgi:hypothetical protein